MSSEIVDRIDLGGVPIDLDRVTPGQDADRPSDARQWPPVSISDPSQLRLADELVAVLAAWIATTRRRSGEGRSRRPGSVLPRA